MLQHWWNPAGRLNRRLHFLFHLHKWVDNQHLHDPEHSNWNDRAIKYSGWLDLFRQVYWEVVHLRCTRQSNIKKKNKTNICKSFMRLSQYGVPVFKGEGHSSFMVSSLNSASSYQQLFIRERCFSSCHERGTKKKILSLCEESKLRPDSVLRCFTPEPQRLYGGRGLLRSSYDTRTILVTPFAIF